MHFVDVTRDGNALEDVVGGSHCDDDGLCSRKVRGKRMGVSRFSKKKQKSSEVAGTYARNLYSAS